MTKARIGKALAVVLCGTLLWTACSTAWIAEAEQIVAALIPAVSNILALVTALQGSGVPTQDVQMVQSAGTQAAADLQLIQSLIQQYRKATDTQTQAGVLAQIQTAVNAVQTSLSGLLPALHVQDAATQAKITAVVAIVLSEVQSLAAIVPLASGSASLRMKAALKQVKGRPPLAAGEFLTSYNATMTAKTGNAELDRATSRLEIHVHKKIVRWATAGWLK
jgi:hypothetical protein